MAQWYNFALFYGLDFLWLGRNKKGTLIGIGLPVAPSV